MGGSFNGKLVSRRFCLKSEKLLVFFFVWSKMAQRSFGLPVMASESVLSGPLGVQGPF